jgi:ABC-2 type transport system permease protein
MSTRHVLLIVGKDMKRRMRSPVTFLCYIAIPIVLTLVVGLVFGRQGEVKLPRIKVLLVDRDKNMASNFFKQGMKQGKLADMIDLVEIEPARGRALMEKGKASALIEIPEGFTSKLLDRRGVEIALLKNPSETFLPIVTEELTGTMAVIMDDAVRIFGSPIDSVRAMFNAGKWPRGSELTVLLESARSRIALIRPYLSDTLISMRSETVSAEPVKRPAAKFNIFTFIMPGSIMIGLLFISEITMRDILRERRAGTLQRIFTSPLGPWTVLAGKMVSAFAITFVACLFLLAVGAFGFGVKWGSPAPLFVHLIGSILMCVGIMALVFGAVKSDRAADAILPVIIIVICIVGGAMVPYESMGAAMQRFARASPAFWVIDGFKAIAIRGEGFGGIARYLAYIFGVGAVTTAAGAALLGTKLKGR